MIKTLSITASAAMALSLAVWPVRSAVSVGGDRPRTFAVTAPTPTAEKAVYNSYRNITIGMKADAVHEKLGTPTQKTKAGDYYSFSSFETAQISYETDQTVKSISVNYSGDLKSAPTPRDVVGTDVKKDSEGMISKTVRYPKDGYYVSYIKTGGGDAVVVITLQKIPVE